MSIGLKIYPASLSERVDNYVKDLTDDNELLEKANVSLSNLANNTQANSPAIHVLYDIVNKYIIAIKGLMMANELDISDCRKLREIACSGNENLNSYEIYENVLVAREQEQLAWNEYEQVMKKYTRFCNENWMPECTSAVSDVAFGKKRIAESRTAERKALEDKLTYLDNVNNATSNLFTESTTYRELAHNVITALNICLSEDGVLMDNPYVFSLDKLQKKMESDLEKAMKRFIDENGVNEEEISKLLDSDVKDVDKLTYLAFSKCLVEASDEDLEKILNMAIVKEQNGNLVDFHFNSVFENTVLQYLNESMNDIYAYLKDGNFSDYKQKEKLERIVLLIQTVSEFEIYCKQVEDQVEDNSFDENDYYNPDNMFIRTGGMLGSIKAIEATEITISVNNDGGIMMVSFGTNVQSVTPITRDIALYGFGFGDELAITNSLSGDIYILGGGDFKIGEELYGLINENAPEHVFNGGIKLIDFLLKDGIPTKIAIPIDITMTAIDYIEEMEELKRTNQLCNSALKDAGKIVYLKPLCVDGVEVKVYGNDEVNDTRLICPVVDEKMLQLYLDAYVDYLNKHKSENDPLIEPINVSELFDDVDLSEGYNSDTIIEEFIDWFNTQNGESIANDYIKELVDNTKN